MPMLDRLSDEAQATGAVDTITCDGDQLIGHNTDVIAFKPALEALVGKKKMTSQISFGPFLIIGFFTVLFCGSVILEIARIYFSL